MPFLLGIFHALKLWQFVATLMQLLAYALNYTTTLLFFHALKLWQLVATLMQLLAYALNYTTTLLFVENKTVKDPRGARPDPICMLMCFFFTLTRLCDAKSDPGVRIIDFVWICAFLWLCAPFRLSQMSWGGYFMMIVQIFVAYELALVLRNMTSEAHHRNDVLWLKVCLIVLISVYIAWEFVRKFKTPENGHVSLVLSMALSIMMDGVEVYAKHPADTPFVKNIIGIVFSYLVGAVCRKSEQGVYWSLLLMNSAHVSVAWYLYHNYRMSEPSKVKAPEDAKA